MTQENFDWDGNKDILITGAADFTARSWSFETGKTLQVSAAPLLKKFRIKDSVYCICPIKRALRGGNDRVCVYLLTKNGNISFTLKNSIYLL